MSDKHNDQDYKEDIELLKTLVGKRIKAFDYHTHEGILSLDEIIFEDGSSLGLGASDYDNLVMIWINEASNIFEANEETRLQGE